MCYKVLSVAFHAKLAHVKHKDALAKYSAATASRQQQISYEDNLDYQKAFIDTCTDRAYGVHSDNNTHYSNGLPINPAGNRHARRHRALHCIM